jgi:hypothetical protein
VPQPFSIVELPHLTVGKACHDITDFIVVQMELP